MSRRDTRVTHVEGSVSGIDFANPESSLVTIPAFKAGVIDRIKVVRTGGSGDFDVAVFQSTTLSEIKKAYEASIIGETKLDDLIVDGADFKNTDASATSNLYLLISPVAGTDNNFDYELYIEDRV